MLHNFHLLTLSEISESLPSNMCFSPSQALGIDLCVKRGPVHESRQKLGKRGENTEGEVPAPWTTQKQGVKAESGIKSGPAFRIQVQAISRGQEKFR